MNRTRGFVNLNRFKSGKAIKRLRKTSDGQDMITPRRRGKGKERPRGYPVRRIMPVARVQVLFSASAANSNLYSGHQAFCMFR